MSTVQKKELTGRTVLILFVGFFVLVFAANGIMTFLAINTFSGVETEDAYRKGRDYNDTLGQARTQALLDWRAAMNTVPLGGGRLAVGVDVTGKDGSAEHGALVEVTLMRPTVQGMDVFRVLPEKSTGVFADEVTLPAPGNWKAIVKVTSASGEIYRLEKKLFVKG
ncbi:MAG: hypothetical protein EP347_01405 [Alphaproteobacteria bacterium]|nr:MAG: hypothetical protein EP347_01405 [Alphaproteobacteria bacterium]